MLIATRVHPETGKLIDFVKVKVSCFKDDFIYSSAAQDQSGDVKVYESAKLMWNDIRKHKLTLARA